MLRFVFPRGLGSLGLLVVLLMSVFVCAGVREGEAWRGRGRAAVHFRVPRGVGIVRGGHPNRREGARLFLFLALVVVALGLLAYLVYPYGLCRQYMERLDSDLDIKRGLYSCVREWRILHFAASAKTLSDSIPST